MTQEAYMVLKIILAIFGIVGGGYTLFKIIKAQATTEADLRNENKKLKSEIEENCEDLLNLRKLVDQMKDRSDQRYDIIATRFSDLTVLEKRVNGQETFNDRIDRKMDEFMKMLSDVRVLLERKPDRQ